MLVKACPAPTPLRNIDVTRQEEIEHRLFQRMVRAIEKIAEQAEQMNEALAGLLAYFDEAEDDG